MNPRGRHWVAIVEHHLIICKFPTWKKTSVICDGFVKIATPIGSMYGIYANIRGILMVNVTIYGIHGSYQT